MLTVLAFKIEGKPVMPDDLTDCGQSDPCGRSNCTKHRTLNLASMTTDGPPTTEDCDVGLKVRPTEPASYAKPKLMNPCQKCPTKRPGQDVKEATKELPNGIPICDACYEERGS